MNRLPPASHAVSHERQIVPNRFRTRGAAAIGLLAASLLVGCESQSASRPADELPPTPYYSSFAATHLPIQSFPEAEQGDATSSPSPTATTKRPAPVASHTSIKVNCPWTKSNPQEPYQMYGLPHNKLIPSARLTLGCAALPDNLKQGHFYAFNSDSLNAHAIDLGTPPVGDAVSDYFGFCTYDKKWSELLLYQGKQIKEPTFVPTAEFGILAYSPPVLPQVGCSQI